MGFFLIGSLEREIYQSFTSCNKIEFDQSLFSLWLVIAPTYSQIKHHNDLKPYSIQQIADLYRSAQYTTTVENLQRDFRGLI